MASHSPRRALLAVCLQTLLTAALIVSTPQAVLAAGLPPGTEPAVALTVTATDGLYEDRVEVSWPSVALDAVIIRVQRYVLVGGVPSGGATLLSQLGGTATGYADRTGAPGTDYRYCTEVLDAGGAVLNSGCDDGSRRILPVTGVKATVGTRIDGVLLTWTDRSGIEDGYVIFRTAAGSEVLLPTQLPNVLFYSDATAVAGTTYTYCIAAFEDANGNGAFDAGTDYESTRRCADGVRGSILPPLTVEASDGTYGTGTHITWTDQADAESGYVVRRDGVLLATLAADVEVYDDAGATNAVTHTYCVATLQGGDESVATCDTGGVGIMPAPTNVVATNSTYDDRVEITWTDPGVGDGFRIRRAGVVIAGVDAGVTVFQDPDISAAPTTYNYCVQTRSKESGVWVYSSQVCSAGSRAPVLAPTQVMAADATAEDRIELTWTNPATQAAYFKITRANGGAASLVKTTQPGETQFTDLGVASGTTYTYCVKAVTSQGIESAAVCDTGSRMLKTPTNVVASDDAAEDLVTLTWVDASAVEKGYRVYRNDVLLFTSGPSRTSYDDPAGPPGQSVTYRVEAFDDNGVSVSATDTGRRTLAAPTGLTASEGTFESEVALAWEDHSRVETGYRIYRDDVALAVTGSRAITYVDTTPTLGVIHTYKVVAIDAYGESSGPTATGHTSILPPSTFSASTGYTDRVVLSWIDVSAIETGFRILRDGTEIVVTAAGVARYEDLAASVGEHMYCAVTVGAGDTSAEVCVSGTRISPPAITGSTGTTQGGLSDTDLGMLFGSSVAVGTDFALAGSKVFRLARGGVQVFKRATTCSDGQRCWTLVSTITDPGGMTTDSLGAALAIDGDLAAIGAPGVDVAPQTNSGGVFVGKRDGDTWETQQKLQPTPRSFNDRGFGSSVGLSGTYLIAGAPTDGTVSGTRTGIATIFALEAGSWVLKQDLPGAAAGDRFGHSVAIDGTTALVGAPLRDDTGKADAGSVSVYRRNSGTGTWELIDTWVGPTTGGQFGASVALDGDRALVGSPKDGSGVVFAYRRGSDGTWSLEAQLSITGGGATDRFGTSVDLRYDRLVVGAPGADGGVGRAWLYMHSTAGWTQLREITSTTPEAGMGLGRAVAIDGEAVLVGYPGSITSTGHGFNLQGVAASNVHAANVGIATGNTVHTAEAWVNFSTLPAVNSSMLHIGTNDNGAVRWSLQSTGMLRFGEQSGGTALTPLKAHLGHWVHIATVYDGLNFTAYVNGVQAAKVGNTGINIKDDYFEVAYNGESGSHFVGQMRDIRLWQRVRTEAEIRDDMYRTLSGQEDDLVVYWTGENVSGTSVIDESPPAVASTMRSGDWISTPAFILASSGGNALVTELSLPPSNVVASDRTNSTQVQITWTDRSALEENFNIYRNGEKIGETGPNTQSFADASVAPGELAEYCVASYRAAAGESDRVCDFGWRPSNGAISGRIASRTGSPVDAVQVDLAPADGGAALNNSLLFDGTGGSVQVAAPAFIASSLSVEAWVRATSLTSLATIVCQTDDAAWADATPVRYCLRLANGTPQFWTGTLTGGPLAASSALTLNTWHHVAATYDGSTERIFIDGVQAGSRARSTSVHTEAPTEPTVIGGRSVTVPGDFFPGQIDEVRLWNVARTVPQISAALGGPLTGLETGLAAYWPFDRESSGAALDRTANAHHGVHEGGVFWSDQAAPIRTSALTNPDGNYSFTGIRYGSGTSFGVRPSKGSRSFDPETKTVALSTDSPVQNELGFTDISSFTMRGVVQFAGNYAGGGSYTCPVDSVAISIDGIFKQYTEPDGVFGVTADVGSRLLGLSRGEGALAHTFVPAQLSLDLQADVSGLTFVDQARETLSGFAGGGCGLSVGDLTVRISTANGCFDQTVELDGPYAMNLPPQVYRVQVTGVSDVPAGLTEADVLAFFDKLGVQEVDLRYGDVELDLQYRAPLSVALAGIGSPICPLGIDVVDADGEAAGKIPNVPLLDQGIGYPLTITVSENYGVAGLCPVENAPVTVFDGIADLASEPLELVTNALGRAVYADDLTDAEGAVLIAAGSNYTMQPGVPNITTGLLVDGVNRSHQKSITTVVEVPGRDAVTRTDWAVVKGRQARTATFTSLATTEIPLMVLHDPPGDRSFSTFEKGRTICKEVTTLTFSEGGTGFEADVKIGLKVSTGVALGPFFATEAGAAIAFKTRTVIGGGNSMDRDYWEICAEASESFSTSAEADFVGGSADVYLGAAFNLIFALADELDVETGAQCTLSMEEVLAADLDASKPFKTVFTYTNEHVENTIIPQIENLIDIAGDVSLPTGRHGKVLLSAALDNWQTMRADNEERIENALGGTVENRSFSAGADYMNKEGSSEKTFLEGGNRKFYLYSEGFLGLAASVFGFDQQLGVAYEARLEYTQDSLKTQADTKAFSYTLSDDDIGDFFSVDVGTDPKFGSPVFGLRSGTSSVPWEPGTQPRDKPSLAINPPELHDIPPDQPAVFTLALSNVSESKETRSYVIRTIQTSNPGGAVLTAQGSPIHDGVVFTVAPDQTQEITLEVMRGPSRYAYENILIQTGPAAVGGARSLEIGDFAVADTVSFSAYFSPPCTDVSLLRPVNPWIYRTGTNSLEIIANGFDLQSAYIDVSEIGVSYRREGESNLDWSPLVTLVYVAPESLSGADAAAFPNGMYTGLGPDGVTIKIDPAATSFQTNWTPPTVDSGFELRGYSTCANGSSVYSEPLPGIVDRAAPVVFGSPEPADQALHLGDDISVTFDERIRCETAVATGGSKNVNLHDLTANAALNFDLLCDGSRLVIVPQADLATLEGHLLEVTLVGGASGLADRVGNRLAKKAGDIDVAWRFTVNQRGFAFSPVNLVLDITRGTGIDARTFLVNGRAQPVTFTVPEFLTLTLAGSDPVVSVALAPSTRNGTLVAGGNQPVTYVLPDTLSPGAWTGQIVTPAMQSGTALGDTPFYLTANVVCAAPTAWTVDPAAFEYSMAITGQVYFDAVASVDENDRIAAFVNGQVRGIGFVQEVSAGVFRSNLLVYSNSASGEVVTFQAWDDSACTLHEEAVPTLVFGKDTIHGSFAQPVSILAPPPEVEQSIPIASGWTWVSFNTNAPSTAVGAVLDGIEASEGDLVKSQTQFALFSETYGWVGTLANLLPGRAYLFRMSRSNLLEQTGSATSPTTPIALNGGWNWVGYLPQEALPVSTALIGLSPAPGPTDIIKSQRGFAQFDPGAGWVGSLTQMEPGQGYLLRVSAAGSLTYPAASPRAAPVTRTTATIPGLALLETTGEAAGEAMVETSGEAAAKAEASTSDRPGPDWVVDADAYGSSMTITAEIVREGVPLSNPGSRVAFFAGEQLRAVAVPTHVPSIDRSVFFVMVYGDELNDEELEVRVYDADTGIVHESVARLRFRNEQSFGTVSEPVSFAITRQGEEVGDLPIEFALHAAYPNPFNPETTIRYDLPTASEVKLEVFDALGRLVVTLVDGKQASGRHRIRFDAGEFSSGVYFYRIRAAEFTDVQRMILLK